MIPTNYCPEKKKHRQKSKFSPKIPFCFYNCFLRNNMQKVVYSTEDRTKIQDIGGRLTLRSEGKLWT